MAVSTTLYAHGLEAIQKGEVDLDSDTLKVALLGDTYTFSQTHEGFSDVSAQEVSGDGYVTGGEALSNVTVTVDEGNVHSTLDADDVAWENSTITARYAVIYDDDAANDTLLVFIDFGEEQVSANGPFTIQWDASGILRFAAAE